MTASEHPLDTSGRSFIELLLFKTPLRDLARGRVTGSLDLSIYPQRVGLSRALADLAVRVTERTRLRRSEKLDVVRELSAHFAEGVAAGKNADALIEEFGDWKQAAKLIRRAKKRNRSKIIRYTSRALGGAFTVLALLYLGVLIWYIAGRGTVNPSHDYLADLNAVADAVPAQDRAWPVYRDTFLAIGEVDIDVIACKGPADFRWPLVREFVAAHQPELARFRDAASMPGLGYRMSLSIHTEDQPLLDPESEALVEATHAEQPVRIPTIDALLPQLGYVRSAAKCLWMDALCAIETGQHEVVIDDIEAMQGIARHAAEHPTLISQLVRISISSAAKDAAWRLLDQAGQSLTDSQFAHLDRLFDPALTGDLSEISFEGERLILRDVEQHSYTDNGAGNGRLRPEMLVYTDVNNPIPSSSIFLGAPYSALMPDRRSFRSLSDRLFDAIDTDARTPMWRRGPSEIERILDQAERSKLAAMRWMYLLNFVPALNRILKNRDLAAMERDALRAMIAIHRYRLSRGGWPDRLADLSPTYLGALPLDRYDGAVLRYRIREDGSPALYSIGHNYRDEQGEPALDRDGWPSNRAPMKWARRSEIDTDDPSIRGDIIYWPPLPEKPLEWIPEENPSPQERARREKEATAVPDPQAPNDRAP